MYLTISTAALHLSYCPSPFAYSPHQMSRKRTRLFPNPRKVIDHHLNQADSRALRSPRSQNNLETALGGLQGAAGVRQLVIRNWQRCLRISSHAFVLFSAAFTPYTLYHVGKVAIDDAVTYLDTIQQQLPHNEALCWLVERHASTIALCQSVSKSSSCTPPLSNSSPVLKLLQQLRSEPAFEYVVPPELDATHLQLLSAADVKIRRLWQEHTTSLPVIVPADACWRSSIPTFAQTWEGLSQVPAEGNHFLVI